MLKKVKVSLFTALALAASGAAIAYQTVTVNGDHWGCANQCVITTFSNGGYSIEDSLGGSIWPIDEP